MRDSDLSMGRQSRTPQETSKPPESEQTVRPGRSPLTSELLAPDEELTEVLDYEDVEENDPGVPDPEIVQAVAHIPQADAFADVEMQESQPPPVLNLRLAGPGMMLTWSALTLLNRGQHPRLRRWKTRCWTEHPPEPPVLAGRVPTKTPAVQRTINFGALFPEELLLIHEDGLLPSVRPKTEDLKTG